MEKRNASRQQTFLKSQPVLDGGRRAVDCLVCDLSESGARLHFDGDEASGVPERFDLVIPRRETTYGVRVVRRESATLGVVFERETVTRSAD